MTHPDAEQIGTSAQMLALLPCPFCGGAAKCNGTPSGMMGQIYCDGEECFGPRTTALTKQDSIVQWNARTAASQDARDALNREKVYTILYEQLDISSEVIIELAECGNLGDVADTICALAAPQPQAGASPTIAQERQFLIDALDTIEAIDSEIVLTGHLKELVDHALSARNANWAAQPQAGTGEPVARKAIAETLDRVAKEKSKIYLSTVCTYAMADAVLALYATPSSTTAAWQRMIDAPTDRVIIGQHNDGSVFSLEWQTDDCGGSWYDIHADQIAYPARWIEMPGATPSPTAAGREINEAEEQIERLNARVVDLLKEQDALKNALVGIAQFTSGDDFTTTLGAINRLVSIRNTAERVLAAVGCAREHGKD